MWVCLRACASACACVCGPNLTFMKSSQRGGCHVTSSGESPLEIGLFVPFSLPLWSSNLKLEYLKILMVDHFQTCLEAFLG